MSVSVAYFTELHIRQWLWALTPAGLFRAEGGGGSEVHQVRAVRGGGSRLVGDRAEAPGNERFSKNLNNEKSYNYWQF